MQDKGLPAVSIIIVNYNGKSYLGRCLASLGNLDYPKDRYEVILVDNNSCDGSLDYVKTDFSWVKVAALEKNYGFCYGTNIGARQAKGEYLVFLNNDTSAERRFLRELISGVLTEKDVVSAGCKLLKPYQVDGARIIDYAGGKFSYAMYPYEGMYQKDSGQYSVKKYTGYGCGAGVMVKKDFFLDIGGFDEYYFGGGEELELGMRAWQYGYKVLYLPEAIVFHERNRTFKDVTYFGTSVSVRNMFYFTLKNYEWSHVFQYLFEGIFLALIPKLIFFTATGDPKRSIAAMRGIYWFLRDAARKNILKRVFEQRKAIRKNKKRGDKELFQLGLMSDFAERSIYRLKVAKARLRYDRA